MLVAFADDALPMRGEQNRAERYREYQSVDGAREDEQRDGISHRREDSRRDADEAYYPVAVLRFDAREERAQERYRGVRSSDDGCDGGAPEDYAEYSVAELSGSDAEGRRRRVAGVEDRAADNDA